MKQKNMKKYVAPSLEVIRMDSEGVIASSAGGSASENEGYDPTPMSTSSVPGSATGSDLEEMINELFTVETK